MAYNDLKTAVNGTFTTQASAASSDLAGVVAGADVLATQFDSLKSTVDSLSTVLNQLVNGQFTVLADSVSASAVTASEGQLYFETDTNTLSVYDGAAWMPVMPTGVVSPFVGASAPNGWLFCDGGNGSGAGTGTLDGSSNTAYNALWTILSGASFAGIGSQAAFTLPDFRGRMPVGKNTANAAVDVMGDVEPGSLSVANRSPLHYHNLTIAGGGHEHTYGINAQTSAYQGTPAPNLLRFADTNATLGNTTGATTGGGAHAHTGTAGVTSAALDVPAFITVNYIIKV